MSMTPLSSFYNQVRQRGVLATNQFKISLIVPEQLSSSHGNNIDRYIKDLRLISSDKAGYDLAVWAKGAVLPTKTIETAEMNYQGLKVQVPTLTSFSNETTIEFVSDSSMLLYNVLLGWKDMISHSDVMASSRSGTSIGMLQPGKGITTAGAEYAAHGGYKGIFDTKLRIEIYKKDHVNCLQSFVLEGAFPTQVGEMTFSNEGADIASFSTTWKYNYWYLGLQNQTSNADKNNPF